MKKSLLVIGGTGSLGKAILRYLTSSYDIAVFSRDEAKHVLIKNAHPYVKSIIGDIRDRDAVTRAIYQSQPDIIINAAALKNVPEVESSPLEGIRTSLDGTNNLNHSALLYASTYRKTIKVLTVSTDKACKPVNSYGMAKALQERLHIRSNSPALICNAVRYGNVLSSRGSLIPIVKERLQRNEPVYITHPAMTRFFLTLEESVSLIECAIADDEGGKVFVPVICSARITDLIEVLCRHFNRDPKIFMLPSTIRPGEKINEILVSEEELTRTERVGDCFVIHDLLSVKSFSHLAVEYSSGSPAILLHQDMLYQMLLSAGVLD